jgi:hypothetical protein
MKRALFVLVVSILLFGVPTLFACEKCVAKGDTDPAGNVHNYPSCYTIASGEYGSCVSGTSSNSDCPYHTGDAGCPEGGAQCKVEFACILEPSSVVSTPALAVNKCSIEVSGKCARGGSGRSPFLR